MTKNYQDIAIRAFRALNLKLSKARYTIKQLLSEDCHLGFIKAMSNIYYPNDSRTIISNDNYPELNLVLSSKRLSSFIESLNTLYEGDSENIDETIDTLYRSSTGEAPRSISKEEMVNESVHAMLEKLDRSPFLYTEYHRTHPRFYNGISLSETDFVIACRNSGIFDNGDLHEEILKDYPKNVERLSEALKNMR